MKNITLKLDDAVIDRVRHAAVDEHLSVSGWVQRLIVQELNARDLYVQNRKRALKILKEGFSLGGQTLSREEMHER
jgi:hypothetical protein